MVYGSTAMRNASNALKNNPTGCLVLFGGLFVVAGIGLFIGLTLIPVGRWLSAQDWKEAPCRIVSSEVASHSDSDGTTYSVAIVYDYEFGGRNYTGNRYDFVTGSSSGREGKQAIVNRYPPGSQQRCYVDPGNPDNAILSKSFSKGYLVGLFGIIFFLAGMAVIVGGLRARRRARLSETALSALAVSPAAASTLPKTPLTGGGQAVLKPRSMKPGSLILGAIFMAIPIAFFLFIAKNIHGDTIPIVFGGLITGIFGLAGASMFFYTLLSLANPRIEARLEPAAVPLGETARFSWRMLGAADRIRKFRIVLRGQEEVRYQNEKNTSTERNIFHWEILAETTAKPDMLQGDIAFALPEFSMHSFEGQNNRIRWTIIVHGDIPHWPDVRDEFPIAVLPLQRKETA